ncbi:glycosyltransferase family 4 protein [Engelhardtia mirabilis]|uniref:Glycosyltransferase EpsD n=1 Tax=Engelhardtia mirabilis TaxID=2528011 RepID=A0A518BK70_9BACT|nr:Putative glycosyltransferase EpsD [Planctomycetes bacterium Pla133]QDV01698.1 Putative glycosyltransferase EpsD [Planctomycetes bacterium Pla86]
MRILHVMEATIGGTRRHLRDVACGQAHAGHEVAVIASAEREPSVRGDFEQMRAAGVQVRELAMVRSIKPRLDASHAKAIATQLRESRPEIVHTHSSKAGALGRWASLRTGIGRRVHTPHTFAFLFDAMFSARKRRLFRTIEVQLGRRTDRLVAVSRGEAETIARSGVIEPARVRVVENGIDPEPWRRAEPLAPQQLGLPAGATVVLVVGLLNSAKGQDLALRALAACERPDAHLLLAGHGEMDAELRTLAAELGIAERAHFLGWRDDVPRLMASCDVLCLPSRWEALPYAVLEAMAAGRAVVASRVDGARDLVQEGTSGFLCEVGDVAGLAASLARAIDLAAPQRAALGAAGRARFDAGYTIDHMVRGLDAVYSELL